jgi:hypothetical protein
MDGQIGVLVCLAYLVHPMSEGATSRNTGKHDVAVIGKKRLREPVPFARLSRDVKFHHEKPGSLSNAVNTISLSSRDHQFERKENGKRVFRLHWNWLH